MFVLLDGVLAHLCEREMGRRSKGRKGREDGAEFRGNKGLMCKYLNAVVKTSGSLFVANCRL